MIFALVTTVIVLGLLRASLPVLDGEQPAAGLRAAVVIERDDLGVPTITASNRLDMVYGLGFVHAQDRFFQMDLARRVAAGELAALLGPPAVNQDKWLRPRRLRHTAGKALEALPADQREFVQAYTDGVNAGLTSLGSRPPEYWVLRVRPKPWRPEDSLLAHLAMSLRLTPPAMDRPDSLLRQAIGSAAFDFFFPRGTDWDAALDGSTIPAAPMPGPDVLDFRHGWEPGKEPLPKRWNEWVRATDGTLAPLLASGSEPESPAGAIVGSNGWAVDGSVSANGAALVASDMHLDYSIPGPHYRVRLKWVDGVRTHDVIGLTLAGLPGVTTGSNGDVAWAPTAAELDLIDQVMVETDPNQPGRYRVPGGWAEFERVTERIEVRGGPPVELATLWTIWGPVYDKTGRGEPLRFEGQLVAQRYVFQSPESVDLRICDLLLATNTVQALETAAESGSPTINLMVGDRAGKVGWTIAGRLPRRVGQAGNQVCSWADGSNGWDGWLSPAEHPRLTSPQVSRAFSANHRMLGSAAYFGFSQPNPAFGARAKQIGDRLARLDHATPEDMLAIQLDDRALLLERWRELLLTTLGNPRDPTTLTNNVAEVIALVSRWNGRATADSVAYRLTRAFRETTLEYVYEPLTTRLTRMLGDRMQRFWAGAERPVWALLKNRPPHLLSPRFASYDDLLLTAAGDVVRELRAKTHGDLHRATWGDLVNGPVRHILSGSLPGLSSWLDAKMDGCGGGEDLPRINTGRLGGSERLAVSPGHVDQGLFQMIAGQSGHFLSPYYRAGHEAWLRGEPKPLLPGPTRHTLRLVSGQGDGIHPNNRQPNPSR